MHLGRVYETLWWQGRSKELGPPPLYMPLVNRANWPKKLIDDEAGQTTIDDYNNPGDTFIYDRLTCDNKPPPSGTRTVGGHINVAEDSCAYNNSSTSTSPNIYRNNASESIQLLPEFYAATSILPTPTSEKYKVDARYTVPLNF